MDAGDHWRELVSADWLGLADRRVLLVGAGGLGRALAGAFLDVGARLIVADREQSMLDELLAEFGTNDRLTVLPADVSTREASFATVERATAEFGGLDVLVHAVGINNRLPINEIDDEVWTSIMAVNAASALWLGQAASATMLEHGGHMIFISSVAGSLAHPNHGAYAASKGALNQLVKTMAVEWAPHGVTVNAIAPGYTLTPLTAAYCAIPGNTERLVSLIPMARLGTPEDIVGPMLLLASDRSAFLTGQVVYVDGGRTLD